MRSLVASLFFAIVVLLPSNGLGAGFARSHNFVILAPDDATAQAVLEKAEAYRASIAREWLGEELPQGMGPAAITVIVSSTEDEGLTWAMDAPDRRFHRVWLTTSIERALGSTLEHEITHVIFASHAHPNRLPAWAEEGVASLKDDPERHAIRRRILAGFGVQQRWPNLRTLFDAASISHSDQGSYAASSSVMEYLTSFGDKTTVVPFAVDGRRLGWDAALRRYYGLRSVEQLQVVWQAWAAAQIEP
jgi:hypothetical protein